MTTVSQIITDAYRQSNLVIVGGTPTTNEQTEALRYLNRIVKSVFGNEVGDSLTAIPVGSENYNRPSGYPWYDTVPDQNWFVPKNTRVVLNLDQSLDIYLHPAPDDGCRFAAIDLNNSLTAFPVTVYGNGNLIQGAASVALSTNGYDAEWFYRADQGDWVLYSPLALVDTFPFPEEFDEYFITMLAVRINAPNGRQLDPQSDAVLARAHKQLRARYSQHIPVPSELGLIRMPKMTADRDQWGNSDSLYDPSAMFQKGWPW